MPEENEKENESLEYDIKLSDNYYLKTDRLNYIIAQKINSNGKEIYRNISYHGTLESLFRRLVELEIRENPTILENIDMCVHLINKLANNLKEYKK